MVLLEGCAAAVAADRKSLVPSIVRLVQQLREARKRPNGDAGHLIENAALVYLPPKFGRLAVPRLLEAQVPRHVPESSEDLPGKVPPAPSLGIFDAEVERPFVV